MEKQNSKSKDGSIVIKPQKVRYIGETAPLELTNGRVYDVLSVEHGWYRILDDTHDDYLYPPKFFEVINE